MKRAANVVNNTLGSLCSYEHDTGDVTPNVHITIDQNKPVKDDFNALIGYRVEASILKEEIPEVNNRETFTDDEDRVWEITQILRETSAKWYVSIIQNP